MRGFAPVLALGLFFGAAGVADAATYCAHYIGGKERMAEGSARSQCVFHSLESCRASVRHRGGGTCYRMHHVPRAVGR